MAILFFSSSPVRKGFGLGLVFWLCVCNNLFWPWYLWLWSWQLSVWHLSFFSWFSINMWASYQHFGLGPQYFCTEVCNDSLAFLFFFWPMSSQHFLYSCPVLLYTTLMYMLSAWPQFCQWNLPIFQKSHPRNQPRRKKGDTLPLSLALWKTAVKEF